MDTQLRKEVKNSLELQNLIYLKGVDYDRKNDF